MKNWSCCGNAVASFCFMKFSFVNNVFNLELFIIFEIQTKGSLLSLRKPCFYDAEF